MTEVFLMRFNGIFIAQSFAFLFTASVMAHAHASTGQVRLILEHSNTKAVGNEVTKAGGQVIRAMETVNGVVVTIPPQALKGLQNRFPDLQITEDITMEIPLRTMLSNSSKGKPGSSTPPPPQEVPWGLTAIDARLANATNRGAGVQVCIVDTGIDKTHPDLQANIVGGRNFVAAKNRVDANAWNDDNGHGSHVAGTVAAIDNSIGVVGVAPAAKLYGVKVLNSRGSGYLSDVADGVTECVRAGSQVINMSLGASSDPTKSSPLKTAVLKAIDSGVVVVVAAGNEGQDIKNTVPAGYPETIAVAAVDVDMNFPSWSNFGLDTDDYSAPGVSVKSTWMSGGYNTISGTSMAAPHVAGVVALKISSGSLGLLSNSLGRSISVEGAGLIDALGTVNNK
jgi:subtilisin